MKRLLTYAAVLATFAIPAIASAQLASNGIFGCNVNGAYQMSVGSMSASGTYVPVSDATVEENTGYLVYDECILRNVVDREREATTAALQNQQLTQIASGRGGNPYFVQNFGQEYTGVGTQAFNAGLPTVVSAVAPAYQSDIQTALARNYSVSVGSPQTSLSCPYAGNLAGAFTQTTDFWGSLQAAENPTCIEMSAYYLAQNQIMSQVAGAQYAWQTQLNWGQGYYPIVNAQGLVTTPGYAVAGIANQAINTGFQQLQSANDIGQMVAALFAGLSTQVLSQTGLTGLLTSVGGEPSYLNQVQQQEQSGLDQTVAGTALQAIEGALSTEQEYYEAEATVANDISSSISNLRSAENQCWNLIIQNVCKTTLSGQNTCQDSAGTTLTIATSTEFSQPIVDSQLAPLGTTTAANVESAVNNTTELINLEGGVQSSSTTVQENAIEQADQLIATQGALHTQADVANATQAESSAQSDLSTLVQNTLEEWSGINPNDTSAPAASWDGSVNDPTGWCNYNDPTTLSLWEQVWGGGTAQ